VNSMAMASMEVDVHASVQSLRSFMSSLPSSSSSSSSSFLSLSSIPSSSPASVGVFLTVDTNVLLSDNKRNLISAQLLPRPDAALVIPWVVLLELDALKERAQQRVAIEARAAISFLTDTVATSTVYGQSADQARKDETARGWRGDNQAAIANDDRILQCTLAMMERGWRTVLVTDDRNLALKASVSGVTAWDTRQLTHEVAVSHHGMLASGVAVPTPIATTHTTTTTTAATVSPRYAKESDDGAPWVEAIDGIVVARLAPLCERALRECYGDDMWLEAANPKPPWETGAEVTRCLHAMFRAVFNEILPRRCEADAEILNKVLRTWRRGANVAKVSPRDAADASTALCSIARAWPHADGTKVLLEEASHLRDALQGAATAATNATSNSNNESHARSLAPPPPPVDADDAMDLG